MNSFASVSTVIFDLGQVIVTFDPMQLCRNAAAHSPHTPEELFAQMFQSDITGRFETGRLSPENFYREASSLLDLDISYGDFKTLWNTIFTLNTATADIIQRLKNVQLLLLSNTNCWHFEYCRESYPVLRHFDAWILSYEVGACKPDRKIFEAALARANARPQECVFIDDIEHYTEAARTIGIRTHTFTTARNLDVYLRSLNLL